MTRPFRIEHKFLVHHTVRSQFLERFGRYLIRDPLSNADGLSPVLSLYYDTPHLDFYHDKLAGFGIRQKVRLRTYGHRFRPGQITHLEIKQRSSNLIRKIRWRLSEFDNSLLDPANWALHASEHKGFFGILLERHRLRPTAQVWYQREAYASLQEPDLRITFDSCVTAMFPREELTPTITTATNRIILPDNFYILEFKSTSELPGWLTTATLCSELQEQPIPKYVLAVDNLRLHESTPVGVYA